MNKKVKIEEIMEFVRGLDPDQGIPMELWADNPAEVARRLNAASRKLGFETHFTADEVKRFKD
jgi:hypothetical protein